MRTTIDVDDALLRRAKVKAAAEGRTLTSIIEEGLRTILAGRPKRGSVADLPISTATGGLNTGYDWATLAREDQEDADAGMVARSIRSEP